MNSRRRRCAAGLSLIRSYPSPRPPEMAKNLRKCRPIITRDTVQYESSRRPISQIVCSECYIIKLAPLQSGRVQEASASEEGAGARTQRRRPMIETDRLGIFHLARPFFTAPSARAPASEPLTGAAEPQSEKTTNAVKRGQGNEQPEKFGDPWHCTAFQRKTEKYGEWKIVILVTNLHQ